MSESQKEKIKYYKGVRVKVLPPAPKPYKAHFAGSKYNKTVMTGENINSLTDKTGDTGS